MRLYWYELKKLFSYPAVWIFIIICLVFNFYLVLSGSGNQYADFIGTISEDTGYVINQEFYEKLSQLEVERNQAELLDLMKADTESMADVFDGYDVTEVGEIYIAAYEMTGSFAEAMRDKYAALQKVVDDKAESDESLTLYFASATYTQHWQLFSDLMGWLILESVLIAVLLVFLSMGYEYGHKTEEVVYSTRKGRHILRTKTGASITAGLCVYVVIATITFILFFIKNNYGNIWGSSVSSVFNYIYDILTGARPFVTWQSFTVAEYFISVLTISIGLVICFSLIALAISMMIRNNYIGFLSFLAANAAMVVLPIYISQAIIAGRYVQSYSMLTPIWLWIKRSLWFTDGDADILWANFETWGICLSLLFLTAICFMLSIHFKKRDLK